VIEPNFSYSPTEHEEFITYLEKFSDVAPQCANRFLTPYKGYLFSYPLFSGRMSLPFRGDGQKCGIYPGKYSLFRINDIIKVLVNLEKGVFLIERKIATQTPNEWNTTEDNLSLKVTELLI
jgi:hypothetical protein